MLRTADVCGALTFQMELESDQVPLDTLRARPATEIVLAGGEKYSLAFGGFSRA